LKQLKEYKITAQKLIDLARGRSGVTSVTKPCVDYIITQEEEEGEDQGKDGQNKYQTRNKFRT
jgi:hypothetical protein